MKQKIFKLLVALLVVNSVVIGGFGGTAVANKGISTNPDCTLVENIIFSLTLGNVNSDCLITESGNKNKVYNITQNQTKLEIYQTGQQIHQDEESYREVTSNYLNDSQANAFGRAEIALAKANESNLTLEEARANATKAVEDYYTKRQITFLKKWNQTIVNVRYLAQREEQANLDNVGFATSSQDGNVTNPPSVENSRGYRIAPNDSVEESNEYAVQTSSSTMTLINGTTVYILEPESFVGSTLSPRTGGDGYNSNYGIYTWGLAVDSPNESKYDDILMVNTKAWDELYQKFEQQNTEVKTQVETFVNNTYPEMQNGTINSSEVLSRTTKLYQLGADGENASYYNIIGALAEMGIETPQLNKTGTIKISTNNTTYEGMLFGTPPNEMWISGNTYNGSDIEGPVLFATTNAKTINLKDKTFTIKRITDTNGNNVNQVGTKEYNYQTTNSSKYQKKLNELQRLNNDLEERKVQAVGGGGSSGNSGDSSGNFNFSIPPWLENTIFGIPYWLIGIAALVVLYYIYETNNY
jgi:hypothetical protein